MAGVSFRATPLGFDPVPAVVRWAGPLQAAISRARGGLERGLRAPQLVRTDAERLVGVERSARARQVSDLVGVQPEAVHAQDGVVLGGGARAVGDVGHPERLAHPASCQPKLAPARALVPEPDRASGRRLAGRVPAAPPPGQCQAPRCSASRFSCCVSQVHPSLFL